ncbi:STAS/SEC14 domain-containing protein [Psychrobacter sp. F1192]|uniref:STAS/SEC14 domain-containing protein n=1 Tax=Psychrobacter coccoides TaxID=2818440 RepID=A0ABS3NMC0_9GAMM|nr:STAS/SEC14 domain-containing protein [Psychrobacter coccoides]MBO1530562.1 STAS/SEC14 domain-containing protein [Psychrobacter coccoides]
MLKQLSAPNHVIAFTVDEALSAEGIQEYRSIFDEKRQQYEQIGIYVEFLELADINASTLLEGIKADIELWRHIDQLSRCAVVSDKKWPQTLVAIIQRIAPKLEIQVFATSQSAEALQWAAAIPEKPEAKHAAIHFLPTNKANVLAFEIDGTMSADEMPEVIDSLERFFADHEKVRLLNRMTHFAGFDPTILIQRQGLLSMKLAAIKKVERYAIVGAPNWMGKLIHAMQPLFPHMQMQTFATDREEEALQWLEAELIKTDNLTMM